MSEENNKVEEINEVPGQLDTIGSDEKVAKVIDFITDPAQKLEALQELNVLSGLINTHYFMPKWDQGNKGTQDKKITGSVQLNFFSSKEMDTWGKRVVELTERLGM